MRGGSARDADVVLEVINGIAFLTPLWLRKPRVALVHHVHRDHYVDEMGRRGRDRRLGARDAPAAPALPRHALPHDLPRRPPRPRRASASPADRIHVTYLGVEPAPFHRGERSPDAAAALPRPAEAVQADRACCSTCSRRSRRRVLDIAGDGDHRPALEAEIAAPRPRRPRRRCTGTSTRREGGALARAWVNLTASSAEGWCLTVMEAAMCRTPSAALRVGGLPESIVDGETGLLADDGDGADRAGARARRATTTCASASARRHERGRASFTWERTARENLDVLEAEASAEREPACARPLPALGDAQGRRPGGGHDGRQRDRAAVHRRCSPASSGAARLRLAGRAGLDLPDPRRARARRCRSSVAREVAAGRARARARSSPPTLAAWRRGCSGDRPRGAGGARVLPRQQIAVADVGRPDLGGRRDAPTGCLWLLLSLERGALQGAARLPAGRPGRSCCEASGRLGSGLVLVGRRRWA